MNESQQQIAKIITETALETIAKKHDTTVELVSIAIKSGQEFVCNQFKKLMESGISEASKVYA